MSSKTIVIHVMNILKNNPAVRLNFKKLFIGIRQETLLSGSNFFADFAIKIVTIYLNL